MRNHEVLLDYMGTAQWGPHGDDGTLFFLPLIAKRCAGDEVTLLAALTSKVVKNTSEMFQTKIFLY